MTDIPIRHPEITVQLSGVNANAYVVLGTVVLAMRRAKLPTEEISEFTREAMTDDYDHLLQTCMKWVDVE